MKAITTAQKIAELKKEIGFRRHVYQNKVNAGTMTKEERDFRIQIIESIVEDYEQNKPVVKQAQLF